MSSTFLTRNLRLTERRGLPFILVALALLVSVSRPAASNNQIEIMLRETFRVIAPPNPQLQATTMAIVPERGALTAAQPKPEHAAGLARLVSSLQPYKRPKGLWIYVFKVEKAARVFKAYQSKRQNRPLQPVDHAKLLHIWPKLMVCYVRNQDKEKIIYPAKNFKSGMMEEKNDW